MLAFIILSLYVTLLASSTAISLFMLWSLVKAWLFPVAWYVTAGIYLGQILLVVASVLITSFIVYAVFNPGTMTNIIESVKMYFKNKRKSVIAWNKHRKLAKMIAAL